MMLVQNKIFVYCFKGKFYKHSKNKIGPPKYLYNIYYEINTTI